MSRDVRTAPGMPRMRRSATAAGLRRDAGQAASLDPEVFASWQSLPDGASTSAPSALSVPSAPSAPSAPSVPSAEVLAPAAAAAAEMGMISSFRHRQSARQASAGATSRQRASGGSMAGTDAGEGAVVVPAALLRALQQQCEAMSLRLRRLESGGGQAGAGSVASAAAIPVAAPTAARRSGGVRAPSAPQPAPSHAEAADDAGNAADITASALASAAASRRMMARTPLVPAIAHRFAEIQSIVSRLGRVFVDREQTHTAEARAATIITSVVRMFLARRRYAHFRDALRAYRLRVAQPLRAAVEAYTRVRSRAAPRWRLRCRAHSRVCVRPAAAAYSARHAGAVARSSGGVTVAPSAHAVAALHGGAAAAEPRNAGARNAAAAVSAAPSHAPSLPPGNLLTLARRHRRVMARTCAEMLRAWLACARGPRSRRALRQDYARRYEEARSELLGEEEGACLAGPPAPHPPAPHPPALAARCARTAPLNSLALRVGRRPCHAGGGARSRGGEGAGHHRGAAPGADEAMGVQGVGGGGAGTRCAAALAALTSAP